MVEILRKFTAGTTLSLRKLELLQDTLKMVVFIIT